MTDTSTLTPEQAHALDVARALAYAGIPIFVASPDPGSNTGFRLPQGWQETIPDPTVADRWRPGMALAVVMGHGLDLLDVDPRSGGDPASLNGHGPISYGAALTPSGGVHSFIKSLGVRSRDDVLPGIDVKAGAPDGKGRGFAFIAPTVRVSKTTGQPTAYRWAQAPDITRWQAAMRGEVADDSGAELAQMIADLRTAQTESQDAPYDGPSFDEMPPDLQNTVTQWVSGAVAGITEELKASADWPDSHTDERGRGWEKLQADAALRLGQLARATWNDLDLADAEQSFYEAAPVDGTWAQDDVELKWRQQAHRLGPAPWPDLRSASERDADAWAALGLTPTAGPGGTGGGSGQPPGGETGGSGEERPQPPSSGESIATRYFGPGGIQAATMAGDCLSLGPLRTGRDDIMWAYDRGVWQPEKHVVKDRLARLLGQRFRTSYVGTVEAIVRAYSESIECEPFPELVNFTNGLLRWRDGELDPHTPTLPITVQLDIDYDPAAQCPAFEQFLSEVVPPDVVPTVWELIGYLMYAGNPLHKAVMLTGSGRNGKGTFLRVLKALLGARNITSVSLHDLVNTRFTTASLFGKLANIAGDIDASYMENTATFKAITGGDTISAEHKGRDRFDFTPWAVPMFSANKIPPSADTSVGYLGRWLVVPFPYSFIGREDRRLDDRLHTPAELQGIAAKGIAHLAPLLARGNFAETTSGREAQDEFYRRVDQVRTWLSDCCEIGPEHPFVARVDLYQSYKTWAFRDGHHAVKASEFYDRLENAGGDPAVVRGTRGFKRIRIIDDGSGPYAIRSGLPAPSAPPLPQTPLPAPTLPAPSTSTSTLPPSNFPTESVKSPTNLAQPPTNTVQTDTDSVQRVQVQGAGTTPPQNHETAGQPPFQSNQGAEGAGLTPTRLIFDHVHAHTSYRGVGPSAPPAPSPEAPAPPAGEPEPPAKPKRTQSPEAKAKAAEKREAKRQAAIATAAGPVYELPALVLRDGSVRSISVEDANALLSTITMPTSGKGTALTVDVETSGYPVGHADYVLRTVQLGNKGFAVVLDPTEHAEQIRLHMRWAAVLHAHSAVADLVPLVHAGIIDMDTWERMYDTVIPAKLADPAITDSDPGLKKLSAAVLGDAAVSKAADEARAALFKAGKWLTEVKVTTEVERSGWAQVDPRCETQVRYAASDVLDTAAIADRLPWPEPNLLDRERTVHRMVSRVAHQGLRLDGEHIETLLAQHTQARAEAADLVRELAGGAIENPGSNDQVGQALTALGLSLPLTRTGKPSVAEGAIEPLRGAEGVAGALVTAVLTYREHDTACGTFLEPYDQLVKRGDGRARPTVYTLGADTGRMSCVRPNLQQVPRLGGFRACITADPGEVLISADFAGVELRVAGALSQDQGLIEILQDPERDIHREIAQLVWGPEAGKAERYRAKPMVFGRLYGAGVAGLARDNGVDEITAKRVIEAMDALTPGLAEWSRMTRGEIEAGRTQWRAYSGRVIHLPKDSPHAGPNYKIQGSARELLMDALLRWSQTRWGNAVILPVHDEVVAKVPASEAAEATEALVACMTSELYGVTIKAEASEPSFAWADSH
jgi:P4 family phage/plasmid primase-like protien